MAISSLAMVLDFVQSVRRKEPFALWGPRHIDRWTLPPLLVIVIFVPGVLVGGQMWLPLENVVHRETVVGYVLEDDGEWITLVRDDDRSLEYVRVADVTERNVCLVERLPVWGASGAGESARHCPRWL